MVCLFAVYGSNEAAETATIAMVKEQTNHMQTNQSTLLEPQANTVSRDDSLRAYHQHRRIWNRNTWQDEVSDEARNRVNYAHNECNRL